MNLKLCVTFCALLFVVFSCTKDDEITVTLKTSGTLNVNVADGNGAPFSNTSVRLMTIIGNYSATLEQKKTDGNGNISFGELNEGNYSIVVDTPKIEGIKYMPYQLFQVISGTEKQLNINVAEFVGTFTLTLKKYDFSGEYLPYSDQKIFLVPTEKGISNDLTLEEITNLAEYNETTDSAGKVSFTIPSDRYFYIVLFTDGLSDILGQIAVSKGSNYSYTEVVYP
ncbi:MAG: hypothetical protein M0P66_18720 [Salinivirgaceae bacterium]|nr:hypothetical protein [Salinivirgaceae bacterium]